MSRNALHETAKVAVPTPPAVDEQGTRRRGRARGSWEDGEDASRRSRSMLGTSVNGMPVLRDGTENGTSLSRRNMSPKKSYHSPQDSEYPDYAV